MKSDKTAKHSDSKAKREQEKEELRKKLKLSKPVKQIPEAVYRQVLYARAFYFVLFGLFYFSCILYPNPLTMSIYKRPIKQGEQQKKTFSVFFVVFIFVHMAAIYTFFTAGRNPGFLDEYPNQSSSSTNSNGDQTNEDIDEELGMLNKSSGKSINGSLKQTDVELRNLQNDSNSTDTSSPSSQQQTIQKKSVPTSMGYVVQVELPPRRFCEICNMEQPYRSRHCKECQRCVRKFDHHCGWIGSCVGELNHGKFWLFLLTETIAQLLATHVVLAAFFNRFVDFPDDEKMRNHVAAVWVILAVFLILFNMFTGGLLFYHTFLIASGQTTWEHSGKRKKLTYLKPYKKTQMPFYISIRQNLKNAFCHNNTVIEWQLPQPNEIEDMQGFNCCENEYWSCC